MILSMFGDSAERSEERIQLRNPLVGNQGRKQQYGIGPLKSACVNRWQKLLDNGQPGHGHGTGDPWNEVEFVSSSISDRQVFAERSRRSRTAHGGFREQGGWMPATAEAVHSLQSGLSSKNREIWPYLADFAVSAGGNSLHFRLSGGEAGIL
jgi:hypothetical protein